MPAMPRPNKKINAIVYKLIGLPPVLRDVKKTEKEKQINKRLIFEETQRVR